MATAEVVSVEGCQAVKLPDEFRFHGTTVSIRKEGEAVILEPIKWPDWPADFFEHIRIDDPAFVRAPQGETPSVPSITP